MFVISELNTFPVKSLGGYSSNSVKLTRTGFEYDRRWMLIDENNKFLTQREFPVMALLAAKVLDNVLDISHKDDPLIKLRLPLTVEGDTSIQVRIWDDTCLAQTVSKMANEWFSYVLQTKCRLVYMPEETERLVDERYAKNKEITTFTDAYPVLIIGEESLKDLNTRLSQPVLMDRFRPNIVFTGGVAYEEDSFQQLTIGSMQFMGVKNCGRCVMTTIDQRTIAMGKDPLKTLAGYRATNNKIYFGRYLLHSGTGVISVGESIVTASEKVFA